MQWFSHFLERLLENEEFVGDRTLERNPFPDKPPTYVRAEFYEYTYAGYHQAAGQWWPGKITVLFPKARLRTEGE